MNRKISMSTATTAGFPTAELHSPSPWGEGRGEGERGLFSNATLDFSDPYPLTLTLSPREREPRAPLVSKPMRLAHEIQCSIC